MSARQFSRVASASGVLRGDRPAQRSQRGTRAEGHQQTTHKAVLQGAAAPQRQLAPRAARRISPFLHSFKDFSFLTFVLRDIWNIGGAHSALMFAARITLPHFSTSSAMYFLKSAGEPTTDASPVQR